MLLVCGHGGNAAPVRRAVDTLRIEGRDVFAFFPSWHGEPHAGRAETALQLALDPSTVLMSRAEPGNTQPLEALMPALRTGGVRSVAENGVLGDPRGATAAEGRRLLDRLGGQLAAAVDGWLQHGTVAVC